MSLGILICYREDRDYDDRRDIPGNDSELNIQEVEDLDKAAEVITDFIDEVYYPGYRFILCRDFSAFKDLYSSVETYDYEGASSIEVPLIDEDHDDREIGYRIRQELHQKVIGIIGKYKEELKRQKEERAAKDKIKWEKIQEQKERAEFERLRKKFEAQ